MKLNRIVIGLFAVGITLSSCGGGDDELPKDAEGLMKKKEELREEIEEINVRLDDLDTSKIILPLVIPGRVENIAFSHFFEVQGQVEVNKEVMLTAEMGGKINKIYVNEGEPVQKGEPLVSINTSVLQKNVEEINEGIELAEFVYEKQKNLFDQGIGSEIQFKQAESQLRRLKKQKEALQAQIGLAIIKAPFSGVIDEVFVNEGEMAGPQGPVLRLINLDQVEVVADISEEHLENLKKGSLMKVELPSRDTVIEPLYVSNISKFVNPTNRTVKIRAKVKNNDLLYPNQLTVVKIRDYHNDSALVIPSKVVQQDNKGNSFVFIIKKDGEDHVVNKRTIKTGWSYKGQVEILSGLSVSDRIVSEGGKRIASGDKVEVK